MPLLPKSNLKRFSLAFFLLLIVLVLIDQAWVHAVRNITVAHDTTRITSPIVGGYPDYLAALNQLNAEGVTPDNNAAPLLLHITGTRGATAAWVQTVYKVWNLPVPATPHLYTDYVSWTKASLAATLPAATRPDDNALEDELQAAASRPWSPTDHPRLAHWLHDQGPALELLIKATDRPRYFLPCVTEEGLASAPAKVAVLDVRFPTLGALRSLANAQIARAMSRIHRGDLDGYQQDILATLRLARLEAQQPALIEQLVGIAIETAALRSIQYVAAADLLDSAHAAALSQQLAARPPFPSLARAFDTSERFTFLDVVCSLHNDTVGPALGGSSSSSLSLLSILPLNYNAVMREANAWYDSEVAAVDLPTYDLRRAAFKALDKKIEAKSSAGVMHKILHPGDLLFLVLLPSLDKASQLHTRCLVEHDLALTALALRSHQLQNHAFPNSLADLAPAFAPLPDRFTDAPLVYHKTKDGYVLYSLGENQKDDGGTPRSSKTGKNYDIVVECPPPPPAPR